MAGGGCVCACVFCASAMSQATGYAQLAQSLFFFQVGLEGAHRKLQGAQGNSQAINILEQQAGPSREEWLLVLQHVLLGLS